MEYFIEKNKNTLILIAMLIVALDGFVWLSVLNGFGADDSMAVYFFDVGQGDSSLIKFPGGVEALIDGGPSGEVLSRLADTLPAADRYIDLVFLSHPQADHISGLVDVVERYDIGIIFYNGDIATIGVYGELARLIEEKHIPAVALRQGDAIRYGAHTLQVAWPPKAYRHKNLNERSLVMRLASPDFSTLFTGDIGFEAEGFLTPELVRTDVLKVPHHGSKYASSREFLRRVAPRISIVQTGKNSYGHPTADALARLAAVGSRIFRTDEQGTIKISAEAGRLLISSKK